MCNDLHLRSTKNKKKYQLKKLKEFHRQRQKEREPIFFIPFIHAFRKIHLLATETDFHFTSDQL